MTAVTAAVLREPGVPPALEQLDLAAPEAGEVLVRIAGVGVCHTDLLGVEGHLGLPLPVVLGHEGSGTVEEVGPGVDGLAVGDAVVLSFDSCGACPQCEGAHPAYCSDFAALNASGRRRDGSVAFSEGVHGSFCGQSSFASHALASARNAVKVSRDVPLELLGPLGCSLQTGAGAVLEVLRPSAGAGLAVFGAGAVGLAGVMAGRVAGCDPVVAIDLDPARRQLALELGAHDALEPSARLGSHDFSLDTVGTADVIGAALGTLLSPGVCATVGFRGIPNPVEVDQGRLVYGRTLTGVIEGDVDPQRFIPHLLELHREGRFPFERLIETFPFAEIERALDAARLHAVVKPVAVLSDG